VTSLGPIAQAAMPADIRNGSPERRATYEGAMEFERMLVQQLTTQLTAGAKSAGATDDSGDGSTTDTTGLGGPYASMLPGAFADGIEAGGGLGLAAQLTDSISPKTGGQA
jgi:Rod binding domain-containing protein